MREASVSNRVLHGVDLYTPQRAGAPAAPAHSFGAPSLAGLQQDWSSRHSAAHVAVQSPHELPTRATAAPLSAVSAEIGTYGPYPGPLAGRHLSSVGLGGASTPASGSAHFGHHQGSSFDGSNGVLLGEYIASLDASTSVV